MAQTYLSAVSILGPKSLLQARRGIRQSRCHKSRFSEAVHLASMFRYARSVSRSSLIPVACTPVAISLSRKSPKTFSNILMAAKVSSPRGT